MQYRSLLRPLTRGKVPFKEQVQFMVRSPPGGTQFKPPGGYTLYRAHREEEDKSIGEPALRLEKMPWVVWQEDLDQASAPVPKTGDVIVDSDGIHWSILKVDKDQQFQCFALSTIRERKMGAIE